MKSLLHLVVALTALSFLAGCGKDDAATDPADAETTTEAVEDAADDATEAVEDATDGE